MAVFIVLSTQLHSSIFFLPSTFSQLWILCWCILWSSAFIFHPAWILKETIAEKAQLECYNSKHAKISQIQTWKKQLYLDKMEYFTQKLSSTSFKVNNLKKVLWISKQNIKCISLFSWNVKSLLQNIRVLLNFPRKSLPLKSSDFPLFHSEAFFSRKVDLVQ